MIITIILSYLIISFTSAYLFERWGLVDLDQDMLALGWVLIWPFFLIMFTLLTVSEQLPKIMPRPRKVTN